MKSSIKNRTNILLISLMFIFLVLGCDAFMNMNGTISDEDGRPISDAKIVAVQGDRVVVEEKSESDGSYRTNGNLSTFPFAGKIKLTVTKEGFQPYEKFISNEDLKTQTLNIVMKK